MDKNNFNNMDNNNDNNKLNYLILCGGLYQIYSNPKTNYNNYEDIINNLFKEKNTSSNIINNNIKEIIYNYSTIISEENINKFIISINEKLKDFIKENLNFYEFETINISYLNDISNKVNIFFIHKNLMELYIDYKILEFFKIENKITFLLSNDIEKKISLNPKNFVCFDYNLKNLYEYHLKGCWTVYCTCLLKMNFKDNIIQPYFKDLNKNNLKIIQNKSTFFNFSIFFFIQLNNYINIFEIVNKKIKNNNSNNNILQNELNKLNPIKCLTIYRYFHKSGEIKRAHLYICSNKVNFISYAGSLGEEKEFDNLLKLNLFGEFNCFLSKISDAQDLKNFPNLIKHIEEFFKNNKNVYSLSSTDTKFKYIYLERDKMVEFINKFIKKFNDNNIQLPISIPCKLIDIYNYKDFKKFLEKNKINLPIIIKYEGPTPNYNHLLINIINDYGLKNYCEYMKDYSKGFENQINQIIQKFVNHGGYVIKCYRINKKCYFYYRYSFPDVSEDLIIKFDEYKRGFLETSTSLLVKEIFINFWKKVNKKKEIKNFVDEKFMTKIAEEFEKETGDTLIGLDFLYDYENKIYYLIDVNQYPGYKELIPQYNEIIIEHIVNYYNEFLKIN